MTVCQFFLRGTCRFGDSCRNEHPANAQQSAFGNSSWNRPSGTTTTTTSDSTKLLPFSAAIIESDLTQTADKPIWPLSSYAPAKHEPLLLAGLDESPEELRVRAVTALKSGNINEYLQYESTKIAAAEQVFANARMNSTQAFEQAVKQSKLPALLTGTTAAPATASAFGQPASGSVFPSTSSAFGTTSVFGSTTTPATSAFGTPAKTSVFGAPATTSAFGNTTTPSAFGSTTSSAFGKPAFGQSALSQPTFGQPAFGQTSTPGAPTNVFGQPQNTAAPVSAFGQPQQQLAQSAFVQASQPATSAFGQSSLIKPASGAFSAFASGGTSSFGGGSNTNTAAGTTPATTTGGGFSAFSGQPSAFGLGASGNTATQNVFGQPSFGQPAPAAAAPAPAVSTFGTPAAPAQAPVSAFGTPAQGTSVFGTSPAFPSAGTSVFGQQSQQQTTSVFGHQQNQAPQPTSVFGASPWASPIANNNAASAPARTLSVPMEMKPSISGPLDFSTMKGTYKPGSTPYDQALPANYMEMLPKSVQDAFKSAKFEWGNVPDWVPPLSVR